jgi:hypothetical protein
MHIPLLALFVATVAVAFLSVEGGYRVGRWRGRVTEREKESSVGAMVAATLGLVAFMLGFTFSLAASRFDARRMVLLDEANAIGTSYLRAALLPEPERTESRRLLRAYVDARLIAVDPHKLGEAISESTAIHRLLWEQAGMAAAKDPRSIPTGLFIQSLNDLIDLHAKRVMVALRNRVPGAIWTALYFVALLAMAEIGYHEGLSGSRRSPVSLTLVLTFSAVIYLIADLDRPQEGLLRVSQQALIDVRNSFQGTGP